MLRSFRQPSAAADCALIGAEAEAMRSPSHVGGGRGWETKNSMSEANSL